MSTIKPLEVLTTALERADGYGVGGVPAPEGDRHLWYRGEAFEVMRHLEAEGVTLQTKSD